MFPSEFKDDWVSTVWLLNLAEITFLASPSLMSLAMEITSVLSLNSLTEPSLSVTLIIFKIE